MVINTGVIGSSNLGEVSPDANRPDGTDADFFAMRMAEGLTTADIRRTRGMFFPVATGRVRGKIFVSIGYTNADNTTTRDGLAQTVRETLADLEELLSDREVALGRELTKLHETWYRGTPAQVKEQLGREARGESFVSE